MTRMPALVRVAAHFVVVGLAAIGAGALLGLLLADKILQLAHRGELT